MQGQADEPEATDQPAGPGVDASAAPAAPAAPAARAALSAREANPDELADWDRHTVDPPGGNALQSRAWATYRSHFGWQPVFLVLSDGARVLGLRRSGRLIRADRAYLSRGPIPTEAAETAARLGACTAWFGAHGVGRVDAAPGPRRGRPLCWPLARMSAP